MKNPVEVLDDLSRQLVSYYLHTDLSHEQSKKLLEAAYWVNKARSLLEEVERESRIGSTHFAQDDYREGVR